MDCAEDGAVLRLLTEAENWRTGRADWMRMHGSTARWRVRHSHGGTLVMPAIPAALSVTELHRTDVHTVPTRVR